MPRQIRNRRARRGKVAAADGGMKGAEPNIDVEAQFDFMSGDPLKGQEANAMATYDAAEAFDKEGSKRAEQDSKQFENGLAAPRGNLSSERATMTDVEQVKARVAGKIAKLLLPHGNAEAIENQAALFAAHMPSTALAATLERCWFDRQGAKISSEMKAKRAAKQSSEKDLLAKAAAMGDEALSMDAFADEDMSADEGEVAEEVIENTEDVEEVEGMGMPSYAAKGEDDEEEKEASAVAAKDEEDEDIPKESSQKKSPKIAAPRRRSVTAADRKKGEVGKLATIYASQNPDCPSDEAMRALREKFSY